MPESHRRASCAHCRLIFYICRPCDRGQIYCSLRCRQAGAAKSRRRANRRHQRSPEGRLDHRDRQRRWRQRQREAKAAAAGETPCVTDVGLATEPLCGSTAPATPLSSATPVASGVQEFGHADVFPTQQDRGMVQCTYCGCKAQFVRFNVSSWGPVGRRGGISDDTTSGRRRGSPAPSLC